MVNHITRTFCGILWGMAATICVTFAAPAYGQSGDYREEYKRYNEAMQSGDLEAAAAHGRAAWQAAEAELGDDGLTGILAYNYGQFVLFSDSEEALAALKRAETLRAAGIADLPADELRLYIAYSEFVVSGEKWREGNALRDALLDLGALGFPPSEDTARMWLQLATSDLAKRDYDEALAAAINAEAEFHAVTPENYRSIASSILVIGISKIAPFPRGISEIEAAHNDFIRARMLFSPQEDIASFDEVLAHVAAWGFTAGAARISMGYDDYPGHEGKTEEEFHGLLPALLQSGDDKQENCGIEWEKRRSPRYPVVAGMKGYIGAVMVGFDLNDDGSVYNERIIAEVPEDAFGDAVLRPMKSWKAKTPLNPRENCRADFITTVTFTLGY